VEQACELSELTAGTLGAHLLPAIAAVSALPKVTLTNDQSGLIARGLPIELPGGAPDQEIAAMDAAGQLAAILTRQADGRYRATRNLVAPS
jgi:hypothetical protein